jgi:nucleoid-associated protein YgaU
MTSTVSARIRALSIISITVIVVLLLLASASHATPDASETMSYRVKGGDTLWQIVGDYGPENTDRRAIIAVIERINGIDAGSLQVGQIIDIPVASS